jgi:hypothetical protein
MKIAAYIYMIFFKQKFTRRPSRGGDGQYLLHSEKFKQHLERSLRRPLSQNRQYLLL